MEKDGLLMNIENLTRLLNGVQNGSITVDEGVEYLKTLPFEQVGDYAMLDHHRVLRCGFPEVVFGLGKTTEQVVGIFTRLAIKHDKILVTRACPEMGAAVLDQFPAAVYHTRARAIVLDRSEPAPRIPGVLVATGGTSDLPVAEEAALTAELLGSQVERLYDVGVAGLHRLLYQNEKLQKARVIVVAAGMEGALASVVGGLVAAPVIAVPTSIGYGASFNGLAALLAMLNSCAAGVSVVNIDNGFGAGYLAGMINRMGINEQLHKTDYDEKYLNKI
jgi:pyridinium-3,5-biscarboxylic acid mononucleotide synthase